MKSKRNPRSANGALYKKHRARLKAQGDVCHICGRPIRWEDPSDADHPWSFVIDHLTPVSRWESAGYSSARACAEDANNMRSAHWKCNAMKGNRMGYTLRRSASFNKKSPKDGEW